MAERQSTPEKLREEVASAPLRILLQEDLVIRGGAQLWLLNCGARLSAAGHGVTFLLPEDSLILEDVRKLEGGVAVSTYDREKIAAAPDDFRPQFTDLLRAADCCVTLVRQKRGSFQNVGFVAECIEAACGLGKGRADERSM